MNIEFQPINTNINYDLKEVNHIVESEIMLIIKEMSDQVISAYNERLTVQELAEKHTIANFSGILHATDEKTKMVYAKLFNSTCEYMRIYSTPLVNTMARICDEMGGEENVVQFIGSFVWAVTTPTIQKLETEQPDSLLDTNLWT